MYVNPTSRSKNIRKSEESGDSIFSRAGLRKYLTRSEINRFMAESRKRSIQEQLFIEYIVLTGCRISEALGLDEAHIDFSCNEVSIKSLKKRGHGDVRVLPVPERFIRKIWQALERDQLPHGLLWPWCRMTGYRKIKSVMADAGIAGEWANPKGLRHAFGVRAIQEGVPLNMVQRWLGHADIKTTTIYANAVGPEERAMASRLWNYRC